MLKKILEAVTPPLVMAGARKVRNFSSRALFDGDDVILDDAYSLFDGDDSLFKLLLAEASVYGEYGCGKSSKWVLANTNADLFSVDSSADWVDHVKENLGSEELKRANIKHVDLGHIEDWGRPISYSNRDNFPIYASWIWGQNKKPDTVLIDGRFRVYTFLTSLKLAAAGTRLIFDDYTNRPHYHVVEKFVGREDVCGRQCLFVVPENNTIDYDDLDVEIRNFKHVME